MTVDLIITWFTWVGGLLLMVGGTLFLVLCAALALGGGGD